MRKTLLTIGFTADAFGGSARANGENLATIEARLTDAQGREVSARAFADAWRQEVGEIPGAQKLVFSASVVGIGEPIVLQVASDDETSTDAAVGRIVEELVPELERDYAGLSVSLGGEQEEQQRFSPALATNFVLAVFAIYAILALGIGILFGSTVMLLVVPALASIYARTRARLREDECGLTT